MRSLARLGTQLKDVTYRWNVTTNATRTRAVAAQAAGTIRTVSGEYDWAFYGAGVLAILASFLVIAIQQHRAGLSPRAATS